MHPYSVSKLSDSNIMTKRVVQNSDEVVGCESFFLFFLLPDYLNSWSMDCQEESHNLHLDMSFKYCLSFISLTCLSKSDVIWQETFLAMKQLLSWDMELLDFALAHRNFPMIVDKNIMQPLLYHTCTHCRWSVCSQVWSELCSERTSWPRRRMSWSSWRRL